MKMQHFYFWISSRVIKRVIGQCIVSCNIYRKVRCKKRLEDAEMWRYLAVTLAVGNVPCDNRRDYKMWWVCGYHSWIFMREWWETTWENNTLCSTHTIYHTKGGMGNGQAGRTGPLGEGAWLAYKRLWIYLPQDAKTQQYAFQCYKNCVSPQSTFILKFQTYLLV